MLFYLFKITDGLRVKNSINNKMTSSLSFKRYLMLYSLFFLNSKDARGDKHILMSGIR